MTRYLLAGLTADSDFRLEYVNRFSRSMIGGVRFGLLVVASDGSPIATHVTFQLGGQREQTDADLYVHAIQGLDALHVRSPYDYPIHIFPVSVADVGASATLDVLVRAMRKLDEWSDDEEFFITLTEPSRLDRHRLYQALMWLPVAEAARILPALGAYYASEHWQNGDVGPHSLSAEIVNAYRAVELMLGGQLPGRSKKLEAVLLRRGLEPHVVVRPSGAPLMEEIRIVERQIRGPAAHGGASNAPTPTEVLRAKNLTRVMLRRLIASEARRVARDADVTRF